MMTSFLLAVELCCSSPGVCPAPTSEPASDLLPSGRLTLGANYWASHAATQMWTKWNEAEVEKDLAAMQAAGMTMLRVFPNWADFQPIVQIHEALSNFDKPRETRMFLSEEPLPDTPAGHAGVDEKVMDRFVRFCDLAQKHDLKLIVCLLTGQMTFRLFCPPALDRLNLYTDPYALKWEGRFIDYFVRRMRNHPAIAAWESGNESRILCKSENQETSEAWMRYIHSIIRCADPTRPVIGTDGLVLAENRPFSTKTNAELSDFVTTHPYGMLGTPSLDDMRTIRSMLFASSQTAVLADVAGKRAFIEEHGARRQEQASQRHLADYMRGMLWNAWDADCRGMLWWCAFDQTGMEIAPYDWKEPCVELGIMKRSREPYPALASFSKFAAFQKALPFAALPRAKPNCLFIVSDEDVAKASYILAKQAGLRPSFQNAEQPIRDAKCYFLPAAKGRAALTLRNWRALKEKVAAGATLYLSLDDTFLDDLEAVAGIEIDFREATGETIECRGEDFSFKVRSPVRRRFRALTAETVARDADGNAVFFLNRYGKGKVYTFVAPFEAIFYRTAGSFACDAYRLYEIVNPVWKLLKTGARDVIATEHCFGGGRCGVVVVNNSPMPYSGTPQIAKGWKILRALTDDSEMAKWTDGKLDLGPNAGILLMAAKENVTW